MHFDLWCRGLINLNSFTRRFKTIRKITEILPYIHSQLICVICPLCSAKWRKNIIFSFPFSFILCIGPFRPSSKRLFSDKQIGAFEKRLSFRKPFDYRILKMQKCMEWQWNEGLESFCSVKSHKIHEFFLFFFVYTMQWTFLSIQSAFVLWSTKQWLFYAMYFFVQSVWRDNTTTSCQSLLFLTRPWFSLTANVNRVGVWIKSIRLLTKNTTNFRLELVTSRLE